MNFPINSSDSLSKSIRDKNIYDWKSLTDYIQDMPYGRNANRKDYTLVWTEQKGTCSSKHAFLKHIAELHNQKAVKLVLAIYRMNGSNTSGLGNIVERNELEYIPEAHCFLTINGQSFDFTSPNSDINKILPDILFREEIELGAVAIYKAEIHKKFIQKWITKDQIPYTFEQIWDIREACIEALSASDC